MADILDDLRRWAMSDVAEAPEYARAADEIERLRALAEDRLKWLAEHYVYSQSDGPDWTDEQRRAVGLQLQFMALEMTSVEGWKAAVAAIREATITADT